MMAPIAREEATRRAERARKAVAAGKASAAVAKEDAELWARIIHWAEARDAGQAAVPPRTIAHARAIKTMADAIRERPADPHTRGLITLARRLAYACKIWWPDDTPDPEASYLQALNAACTPAERNAA
jgi:hypothetical protein